MLLLLVLKLSFDLLLGGDCVLYSILELLHQCVFRVLFLLNLRENDLLLLCLAFQLSVIGRGALGGRLLA